MIFTIHINIDYFNQMIKIIEKINGEKHINGLI